jgi:hypothetical protein
MLAQGRRIAAKAPRHQGFLIAREDAQPNTSWCLGVLVANDARFVPAWKKQIS